MPENNGTNTTATNAAMVGADGLDYSPISTWGFVGYQFLFAIPLVGFILLIVFAVGGTKKVNLRNFARSYFCILLIGIVIAIAVVVFAITTGVNIAGLLNSAAATLY